MDQNENHFELYLLQNYAVSLVATLVPVIYNQHNKVKTVTTPSRQSDDFVVTQVSTK